MRIRTLLLLTILAAAAPAAAEPASARLDPVLRGRARQVTGTSRVIVQFRGTPDARAITGRGGVAGQTLSLLRGQVAEIHNTRLAALANDPRVLRVSIDRPAFAAMERTGATVGAATARLELGLTGAGVGVAVIDSGVSGWHNDLNVEGTAQQSTYVPRVVHFRDFANAQTTDGGWYYSEYPYDDFGHGTHVAGIIAGNGYDSAGARTGIAPKANIVALKVLDANGTGYISNVIAALDYAVSVKDAYNIRVINLSVGAGVYESYHTDPLAQAAKRAVDAGVVVVTASGNLGRHPGGGTQYGGVTSPGNAPWVLTVGAATHNGTTVRSDDSVAPFSSRGPTWIDFSAKPDLVAPGVGIESLSEPYTTLYERYAAYRLPGSDPNAWYMPYLSLSGTSMAAPVVAGTVALMLEANPELTPNAVKAILQYTAQVRTADDFLTQGSGYLNARGAIRMARFFANPRTPVGEAADDLGGERVAWSERLIWGNYRLGGGLPMPGANAWELGQQWGALATATGGDIIWGAASYDNIVWSMQDDNIVWSMQDENIVWSMDDNIVWSMQDDNIVWSMSDAENIVWSMDCGGADCNNVAWGETAPDGSLWGTAESDDNIVWSQSDENIVWSQSDDNIVWSQQEDDNIVWSMGTEEPTLWPSASTASGKTARRGSKRR